MGKLIDADALINTLKKEYDATNGISGIITIINKAPAIGVNNKKEDYTNWTPNEPMSVDKTYYYYK